MSKDTKEKRWLIKKNHEILGPFSDEEVEEDLNTGHFSVLDSACLPDKQVWLCLGNYEKFSEFMSKQKEPSGTAAQTLLSRITDTIFVNTGTFTETSKLDVDDPAAPVVEDVDYKMVAEKSFFHKIIETILQRKIILFPLILIVVLIVYLLVA